MICMQDTVSVLPSAEPCRFDICQNRVRNAEDVSGISMLSSTHCLRSLPASGLPVETKAMHRLTLQSTHLVPYAIVY